MTPPPAQFDLRFPQDPGSGPESFRYFDGFRWAVLRAFHEALDRCRFERGDILYDSRDAYEREWLEALKVIRHWIQVRSPERDAAVTAEEGVAEFDTNWRSEVQLDLHDRQTGTNADVVTTQGRLYSAIWKGNLSVLNMDCPEPEIPLRWREVPARLESTVRPPKRFLRGTRVFLMPHDPASTLSVEKFESVRLKLKPHLSESPVEMLPSEAGWPDAETFAPTVYLAFFPVRGLSRGGFEEELKSALYRPTKGVKKPRYRLSAHGVIL